MSKKYPPDLNAVLTLRTLTTSKSVISSKAIRKKKFQENCNISPLLFIKRLSNNELNFTPKVRLNTSGTKFKVRQSLFYYTIQHNNHHKIIPTPMYSDEYIEFHFLREKFLSIHKRLFPNPPRP